MERKIIYLNEFYTSKLISLCILGIVPNKPYLVLDEINKTHNPIRGKYRYEKRYKIEDDYGNRRWIDSHYFFDYDEWRDNRISGLLD